MLDLKVADIVSSLENERTVEDGRGTNMDKRMLRYRVNINYQPPLIRSVQLSL